MAAANFLTKAMALPAPPPPPQLALKGDWSEMNHARTATSLHIPTPLPLAPLHAGKMPKRALASNTFAIHNRDTSGNDASRCPEGPSLDCLSEEAQRFLEEDPFDFDALPHPVLTRQQAVCNVYAPMYANTSEVDDTNVGGAEPIASAPELCNKPRWNASIVGASLAQAGRGWNAPLLTRSDGDLR